MKYRTFLLTAILCGCAYQNPATSENAGAVPNLTEVQFCSGGPASYSSTFPEYGLCISGNIYAVYSANDGFLTELPPGVYTSNGVNSSCTFTVGPDCQIVPQ